MRKVEEIPAADISILVVTVTSAPQDRTDRGVAFQHDDGRERGASKNGLRIVDDQIAVVHLVEGVVRLVRIKLRPEIRILVRNPALRRGPVGPGKPDPFILGRSRDHAVGVLENGADVFALVACRAAGGQEVVPLVALAALRVEDELVHHKEERDELAAVAAASATAVGRAR